MQTVRIFLFRLHTWIGLNVCILLGIMFATGTLLVFSTDLETAFYAKPASGNLPDGKPRSFGQVFDSVQAAYPDVRIAFLFRDGKAALFGDRVQVKTKWGEEVQIWSDPGTGEILGASPKNGVREVFLSFHDSLFTGKGIGQAAVSTLAFVLLTSVVTGLLAYRRFWRGLKTLPPRGRGARPWWGGLHRFVAVWSLPFLLTVAVTGIYYFVVVWGVIPTNGPKIPPAAEREAALPAGFDGAMLDRAVAVAQRAAPNQRIAAVVLPFSPKQGITFSGPPSDFPVELTKTKVVVDPKTMTVLAIVRPDEWSPKDRAKHFFDSLHHGDWAGNYSRIVWLLFGATGTILMFSGAMVYAARSARMSRPGSPRSGSSAAPQPAGAARRVWCGMYPTKWALIPLALAVAGIGIYRYGVQGPKWTVLSPHAETEVPARLAVLGPMRAGEPLSLRLIIDRPGVAGVSASWDGGPAEKLALNTVDDKSIKRFTHLPSESANTLTVRIDDGSPSASTAIWRLGRPIL